MGCNAGSRKVRSPANTRAMKPPSGLVTAKISARNTKICSQPLMVISKFLRTQKRVEQINRGRRADDKHDERLEIHRAFLFHAVAEMHVCDREGKECDRDCGPKNVLHSYSPKMIWAVDITRHLVCGPTTRPVRALRCSDLSSGHPGHPTRTMAGSRNRAAIHSA